VLNYHWAETLTLTHLIFCLCLIVIDVWCVIVGEWSQCSFVSRLNLKFCYIDFMWTCWACHVVLDLLYSLLLYVRQIHNKWMMKPALHVLVQVLSFPCGQYSLLYSVQTPWVDPWATGLT